MKLARTLLAAWLMFGVGFQAAVASEWEMKPGNSSANLAATNDWDLISSSAMSWPDGRQLLITFWESQFSPKDGVRILVRCYDYFAADMQSTGAICYTPEGDQ
jgi:hypothetical protein